LLMVVNAAALTGYEKIIDRFVEKLLLKGK
jgi:hypothetical protein